VWDYAKKNGYTIVTQDSDFNDLSTLCGSPPIIIWIRSGNLKTSEIAYIIIEYKNDLEAFLRDDNLLCFEIIRISNQ
jgi:predicted nuclease of predicted toxin-antitoxin system